MKRLDVLNQRRAPEHPDLSHIGRSVAGQAALALDAFNHRRFLATDVGPGTAAQVDGGGLVQPRRLDLGNFFQQHFP